MSIRSIKFERLVEAPQRKDHILFPITSNNVWGDGGWNCELLQEISCDWDEVWADLGDQFKSPKTPGEIITREANYITYHALVLADPNVGYDDNTRSLLEKAMNDFSDKVEDDLIRPVKSVPFGFGKYRFPDANNTGRPRWLTSLQANSEIEFDLYSETL